MKIYIKKKKAQKSNTENTQKIWKKNPLKKKLQLKKNKKLS